jgi:uncharacterized protein YjbI with pentapeptide repeats
MAVREKAIKAIEAVQAIRAGLDDAALMERFNVTAKGLQSLLEQLEAAGIMSRDELENRGTLVQSSLVLDRENLAPPKKLVVDAAEALQCIKSGMDDATLMKRFRLSAKGLESLFKKLVAVKAITPEELEERLHRGHSAVVIEEETENLRKEAPVIPEFNTTEMIHLILSGTDREALRDMFQVSNADLDKQLEDLIEQGAISKEELDRRLPSRTAEFQIKHRDGIRVIFSGEAESLAALVEKAVRMMVDLTECDLAGTNLARSNLSGARLVKANLRKTILTGTDFTGARLTGATLASADLTGAVLYKANLADADLSDANLSMVSGAWAFLHGANLSEANLTKAYLAGANLTDADVFEAILSGANLRGACLDCLNFEFSRGDPLLG